MVEDGAGAKAIDLEEFMRLLPHLDAADLMSISATYQQADGATRDAARAAASAVARARGLIDELGRLQGSIIQWAGSNISRTSAFTLEGLHAVHRHLSATHASSRLKSSNLRRFHSRSRLRATWFRAASQRCLESTRETPPARTATPAGGFRAGTVSAGALGRFSIFSSRDQSSREEAAHGAD